MGWTVLGALELLATVGAAHYINAARFRELSAFLERVANPVAKDYFAPFTPNAGRGLRYGNAVIPGYVSASTDGLYLESVGKFYAVIPVEDSAQI